MGRGLDQSPREFARVLADAAGGRAFVMHDPETGALRISHPCLEGVAGDLGRRPLGFAAHEALFLAAGPGDSLFGAFVHSTVRGQAQGGVRRWGYAALEEFLRDGLRLSHGMSRKNALAGLWWGGGKGVIARADPAEGDDPEQRRALYEAYGRFVASLRGVFLAAEDVGTRPEDVASMFSRCRFVTCVPPEVGGSGNPSPATALGVAAAMEAGLDWLGRGALAGKRVAVQGCGQVGRVLVGHLLERGARVVAADPSPDACAALAGAHPGAALEVRAVPLDDRSILYEDCDVLAPCALGGVLDGKSIPGIRAALVCGSANNQLGCELADDRALAERGITWIPDFLCNRMGIVTCGNEPFGQVPGDPEILKHLDPAWPGSIPAMTRLVLERATASGITPGVAADRVADEALREPHPLHGHRGRRILAGLAADRWAGVPSAFPGPVRERVDGC